MITNGVPCPTIIVLVHLLRYSHLAEFSTEHILRPGYDVGDEVEYRLALKGLENASQRNRSRREGLQTHA